MWVLNKRRRMFTYLLAMYYNPTIDGCVTLKVSTYTPSYALLLFNNFLPHVSCNFDICRQTQYVYFVYVYTTYYKQAFTHIWRKATAKLDSKLIWRRFGCDWLFRSSGSDGYKALSSGTAAAESICYDERAFRVFWVFRGMWCFSEC